MDPDPTTPYDPPTSTTRATPPPPPPGSPPPAPPAPQAGEPAWWRPDLGPGGPASTGAPAGWDTPRPGQGNGCLRACLIVGLLLVGVSIAGIVGLAVVGGRVAQEFADNPEAFLGEPCPYVSDAELSAVVGQDVIVMTLEGIADGTMGAVLDKRLLGTADDCWAAGEDGFAARIAVADSWDPATYDEASAAAAEGGFLGAEVPGLADEAVCTTMSLAGSTGVLARWGERVVYVSVVDDRGGSFDGGCDLAVAVAATLEP